MDRRIAKFAVGQIVHHTLFNYRGVIVDVDAEYSGTNAWYEEMAPSRPPKSRPWYHVLMHGTDTRTYVAERNLEADDSGDPIDHPDLERYFVAFADGTYVARQRGN
ncbi:MAG: heat shock protein HspQ [Rhodospirillales bacterium]|nr:heat shock protein HspQ [Rhodospirillales bacterium]